MTESIFTAWKPEHSALWGNVPLRLKHRLHQHELFSRPALARPTTPAPTPVTRGPVVAAVEVGNDVDMKQACRMTCGFAIR